MLSPTPTEPPPPPRAIPEMIRRVASNLPDWIREEVFGPTADAAGERRDVRSTVEASSPSDAART